MPDLTDQLHGYHDALAATVEPVTAAEAMTTAAPLSPEARHRRARWQWRIVAAAAAVLVIVVGSVAVMGGSGPMRWLTGDEADALRGRTFLAVSMTESGGAPERAVGSVRFSDDAIDLDNGCNTVMASFTVEQGRLTIGPAVSTAMDCGLDGTGPERWTRVLGSAAIALDGDRLTLSDDTISVELVDQPSSGPPGTTVVETLVTEPAQTTSTTMPPGTEGAAGEGSILVLGSEGAVFQTVEELIGASDLVVVARTGAVRNLGGSSFGSTTSERALFSQRIVLSEVIVARPGIASAAGDDIAVVWSTANDLDAAIVDRYANGSMDLGGVGTGVLPDEPVLLFLTADQTSALLYPSLDGPTFRIVGGWQGARVVEPDGRLADVDFFASDPPNVTISERARMRLRDLAAVSMLPDISAFDGATLQDVEILAPDIPPSEPPGGEG